MACLYIVMALIVIGLNFTEIPRAFMLIIESAFTPVAAFGGFAGSAVASTIKAGAARGAYSNEAGIGVHLL